MYHMTSQKHFYKTSDPSKTDFHRTAVIWENGIIPAIPKIMYKTLHILVPILLHFLLLYQFQTVAGVIPN